MRVIRGVSDNLFQHGCVATIGNFDGVHTGHQAVIQQLAEQGKRLGLPVVVLLFEPQPLEFFRGDDAPSRLTRFREKICQLKSLPVDVVVLLRFDGSIGHLTADEFVDQVLVSALNIKYLMVGDDFRFGRYRQGDFGFLKQCAQRYGFQLQAMDSFISAGQRVSSTAIREALLKGQLKLAEVLLGRPYTICGRVIHGDKKGRTIGFPTANIPLHRKNSPVSGVFAVTMQTREFDRVPGVANIGVRPTVDRGNRILLEAHLFDFEQDLYGQLAEVTLVEKIREERRFESFDALKCRIEKDVLLARNCLIHPSMVSPVKTYSSEK